jgi:hypothetical protein
MFRLLLDIVVVLAIDLAVLLASLGPSDEGTNVLRISAALRAREANPTIETQRALIDAFDEPSREVQLRRLWASGAILVITGTGLFLAGRRFERRHWQKPAAVENI